MVKMRKMRRKFSSSARRKALSVRGGFSSRSALSRAIRKGIAPTLQHVVKETAKTSKNPLWKAADAMSDITNKNFTFKLGKVGLSMVNSPNNNMTAGRGNDSSKDVGLLMEKSHKVSGMNNIVNAKRYTVNFESGIRSSKSVLRNAKENGTVTKRLYDTRYDLTSALQDTERGYLSKQYGFNRKVQFMFSPQKANMTMERLYEIYRLTDYDTPDYKVTSAYGDMLWAEDNLMIMNTNAFLPCTVTVHLLNILDEGFDPLTQVSSCFNTAWPAQSENAIPSLNQLSLGQFVGSEYASIEVDPNTRGIMGSNYFKTAFNIEKSFKRKLAAGDSLIVSHKHHCGGGIRLDELIASEEDSRRSNRTPLSYAMLVEVQGIQCEAVDALTPTIQHLGKSSGSVACEYWVRYKAAQASTDDILATGAGADGFKTDTLSVRKYVKSAGSETLNRIFSISYDKIIVDASAPGAGEYYIPIATQATIDLGGKDRGTS